MNDAPHKFTDAERTWLAEKIDAWKRTGYGVDPNQPVFRHHDARICRCWMCADGPIQVQVWISKAGRPTAGTVFLGGRRGYEGGVILGKRE